MTVAVRYNQSATTLSFRAKCIETVDELRELLPDWVAFLDRGTIGHHVENDPRMIFLALRQDPALKPLVVVIWKNDHIKCIAPFYLQDGRFKMEISVWQPISLRARILRIFGEQFVFSHDADQRDCIAIVLDVLQARKPAIDYLCVFGLKRCDGLWLHGIDQQLFQSRLQMIPRVMRSEKNHQIQLPENLDQYLASLSPSTRQNLRRTTRRFFEDGRARVVKVDQPCDVAKLLDWLDQIHCNSWQGRTFRRSSRNSDSQRRLLEDVATQGWLQSYVLLHDEQPVAFEHGYRYRGVYYGLDCAYDQNWSSAGPGSILIFLVIQELMTEGGVTALDFGFGDMPYKRSFSNLEHDAATVYFVPRNRWRLILKLQTILNSTYDVLRAALVRLRIDRFFRKLIKWQK